jgi:hypothetical protein
VSAAARVSAPSSNPQFPNADSLRLISQSHHNFQDNFQVYQQVNDDYGEDQ